VFKQPQPNIVFHFGIRGILKVEGYDVLRGILTRFTLKLRNIRGNLSWHIGPIIISLDGVINELVQIMEIQIRRVVQKHMYSNKGQTTSVTTHTTISNINTLMFLCGKTPVGKHPWP
jgi:hypothetical protein